MLSVYLISIKLFIPFNGPEVGEADNIIKQALDFHFAKYGKGWHFFKLLVLQFSKVFNRLN